jgi:hypothetical protein
MRAAITVAMVLVWAAPAVAQSTAIDTGPATSVQVPLPPETATQKAQTPAQSAHVSPQTAQPPPATAGQQTPQQH